MSKPFLGLTTLTTAVLALVCSQMPVAHAGESQFEQQSSASSSIQAPATRDSGEPEGDFQSASAQAPQVNPAEYWTEDKMRNAVPADIPGSEEQDETAPKTQDEQPAQEVPQTQKPEPGETSQQDTPANHPLEEPANTPVPASTTNPVVPSTVGKIFYTYKGVNYVCSGAAVNNEHKNLVATAGHCVHGGQGEGWHTNIIFVPAYYNGSAPYGKWSWKEARTFDSWKNSSNYAQDQAFLTVQPQDGRQLVDVVGGNGMMYNYVPNQSNVRIWGWPAEKPYNGEVPYYCDGNTSWTGTGNGMYMNCPLNGGASGGPWIHSQADQNTGYIFGVTSRRTVSGTPALVSTPFDSNTKELYLAMKG